VTRRRTTYVPGSANVRVAVGSPPSSKPSSSTSQASARTSPAERDVKVRGRSMTAASGSQSNAGSNEVVHPVCAVVGLPAASSARMSNVWGPRASAAFATATVSPHGSNASRSTRHSTSDTGSLAVQASSSVAAAVVDGGAAERERTGSSRSTVQACETSSLGLPTASKASTENV
jgi:hypothetical protein